YQWSRCDSAGNGCVAISGATGQSYLLASADVGATMRVTVTASNSAGSASGTSAATAVVTSLGPPSLVSAPVVSGTTQQGQTSAPQCSRTSLSSCPASYFTGPLGNNNLIPTKPGAFLIDEYGGIGTSWAQKQAGVLQRQQDLGRKFDGVGFHYGGSDSWD